MDKDVTKQKDLTGFYLKLEKNIAFGGKAESLNSKNQDDDDEQRRSPSPGLKAERAKRKRERAETDMVEAKRLKEERDAEKQKQLLLLREQYSKHQTDENEVSAARERYLQRKLKKQEELQNLRK